MRSAMIPPIPVSEGFITPLSGVQLASPGPVQSNVAMLATGLLAKESVKDSAPASSVSIMLLNIYLVYVPY